MKRTEREELLARAMGGDLDPGQQARFEALLSSDEDFRREWERQRRVAEMLSAARAEGFGPWFPAGVVARLRGGRNEEARFAEGLTRLFRPLVPVTLAVALVLAALNWGDRDLMSDGSSFLEITFAVPPVSAETAELLEM